MAIRVTRLALEVVGETLGRVSPIEYSLYYVPFIRNNWSGTTTVETSWLTSISKSYSSGAEQRIQLRKRPIRTIKAILTGLDSEKTLDIQTMLYNIQQRSTPFPIYSDRAELLQATSYSGKILHCDTRFKRLYAGQRILAVPKHYHKKQLSSSVDVDGVHGIIADVTPTQITLESALGYDFYAGDYIYPLIDTHPEIKSDITAVTDYVSNMGIGVVELEGPSALPPSWGNVTAPEERSYQGYPILELKPNWTSAVKQSLVRDASRYSSGRGTKTTLYSESPKVQFEYTDTSLSKKEAWKLLRFFDSRQGRTLPFWCIQPITSLLPKTVTTTYTNVERHSYIEPLKDMLKHVAITERNGTTHIKQVSNVELISGEYRISYDTEPFESLPSDPVAVTPAWLCRFNSDTLAQVWTTDQVCSSKIKIIQILNEKSVKIEGL